MAIVTPSALLEALGGPPDSLPLRIDTPDGPVRGGYHVTELRRLDIHAIDCAGETETRREAALQVLDGAGGSPMPVGRFRFILEKSIAAVPGLADAPLHVEFAPGNAGLSRYRVGDVFSSTSALSLRLVPDRAVCRPFERRGAGCRPETSCCT